MPGVAGGTVPSSLDGMLEEMWYEPWYEADRFGGGEDVLGVVHHGDRDPGSHLAWVGDGRAGVVYGATPNRADVAARPAALFGRVLECPDRVLSALDGSFVIAAVDTDANRFVVATDRLGCRPCYYTTDGGFAFASELKALFEVLDDPALDEQAASDLLLMGHLWGDRTLLRDVRFLRPASYLEYEDGEATVRRYWRPSFDEADPGQAYVHELLVRYRSAVAECAGTLPRRVGVWLSGGLDSRSLLAELARSTAAPTDGGPVRSLGAFTYDANPAGGRNPRIARRVARTVGVDLAEVDLSPEPFIEHVERTVALADGMVRWNTLLNLSAVFGIDEPPGVMIEGAGQGELVGHHLRQHHLTAASSAIDSQYMSEAALDADAVRSLLTPAVDPFATFRAEAAASDESTLRGTVLDVHFRNYYARQTLASNPVVRAVTETRVPYVTRDLLEHAAALPLSYRMGTFPFTDGAIPYGATKPKLGLIRAQHTALARIPYERTGVAPVRPFPAHVAGFVAGTSIDRLLSRPAYGGRGLFDEWYSRTPAVREWLDGLLDDACDRPLFDEDAVRDVQRPDEPSVDVTAAAGVTTLELWLQAFMD